MSGTSGPRIHWTNDEKELVVEAMAEHLLKVPHAKKVILWKVGNDLLAPDRRRQWYGSYSGLANPAGALFTEAHRRMEMYAHSGAPQKPVETTKHIPMQQEVELTWVPVPTPAEPLTVKDFTLEALLTEVIARVLDRVAPLRQETKGDILERIAREQGIAVTRVPLPVAPDPQDYKGIPVPRPVRIALCGPLKDQFNRVKERINAKKVELVLVDNQKSVDANDFKQGLDYVLVTRFIRHSHSELANQAVGRSRVFWVAQSTEAAVAKIVELVPGSAN